MFGSVHDELALDGPHAVHLVLREQLVTGDHQRVHVGDGATCSLKTSKVNKNHRLLLLKLDKQSGGTIYRPFLVANEALGVGCSKPCSLQELAGRWLRVCLSSFNNRRLCQPL